VLALKTRLRLFQFRDRKRNPEDFVQRGLSVLSITEVSSRAGEQRETLVTR